MIFFFFFFTLKMLYFYRFQYVVQFGPALQTGSWAFQLSPFFHFAEIIIYFRYKLAVYMFCLCLFYKMVVGLFSAYVANFCTTGVLVIILILYLCLVLSAALWPSTVAYCQMAFTLLCEEGFYFVLRQKKKKTKEEIA